MTISITTSFVHLTGLRDRNYFDARLYHFEKLSDSPSSSKGFQLAALPVIDRNIIFDQPVLGGQLSMNQNFALLTRNNDDTFTIPGNSSTFYRGVAGTYARATTDVEWQKRFIGPNGQVVTPFAYVRGDSFALDNSATAAALTGDSTAYRVMPAVGFDWSMPILARIGATSHIIEPKIQFIARPNETYAGSLPNNDAQSLVFDDSTLFARDKFSGYDRVEGGTRVNAGLHYLGLFPNGYSVDALVGQSYLIAGQNSFAAPDLAATGMFSGLQDDVSDVVARIALDNGKNMRLTARGRFDHNTGDVNRGEIIGSMVHGPFTGSFGYQYLRNDPSTGLKNSTSVLKTNASYALTDSWRAVGSMTYDLTADALAEDSFGFAFQNSCLTLGLTYAEKRDTSTQNVTDQTVTLKLALRTLGGTEYTADVAPLLSGSN